MSSLTDLLKSKDASRKEAGILVRERKIAILQAEVSALTKNLSNKI